MSLTGKRVMVVGGSSGIGLAAARRLAGMGARVIVVGRAEDKLARAGPRSRGMSRPGPRIWRTRPRPGGCSMASGRSTIW